MRFSSLVMSASAASAAVISRQANSAASAKLLIGQPWAISIADYDGKEFKIVANLTEEGTSPSWMTVKEPNLLYAVDENSNFTRLYNYDTTANSLKFVANGTGASGVVSLAFNSDKTRLVGASYGEGKIDVWDVSSPTELKLLKQLQATAALGPDQDGGQTANRAHQAILDPSGRFFAVNDLGSDTILVIDSKDDAYKVVNVHNVGTAGCGPRHGVWYPAKSDQATHYIVVCEMLNLVQVFKLDYNGTGIGFTRTQELSTFGAAFPPATPDTAAAGEIALTSDNNHVYISNRLTGNDTDSIAHFKVKQTAAAGASPCKAVAGGIELEFVDSVSSGGKVPRMFSLSCDDKTLFVANQQGTSGIVAFGRGEDGKLTAGASLPLILTGAPENSGGFQFVQQIA
ncbi:carboxy-cis, cis-muconate cyclase [Colletotrichum karsti]|uniref:Carboxy-cis, cis-muconate cyclase n=1 Tax=Colletotrichum karsti TaxID=1095194 RepID=A0A9P6LLR2_9PEZI|nr:carboxy-cis, cis-muconate cyclase [Colletotrichum karsti]KAF9878068.1 carboxy-cis, cis-muconate cyclase [Colletotrichum karsti]